MSITSEIETKNIKEYAELSVRIYDLECELSYLCDKLINLQVFMEQEDIIKANKLYELIIEERE